MSLTYKRHIDDLAQLMRLKYGNEYGEIDGDNDGYINFDEELQEIFEQKPFEIKEKI